jgi:hypothetical protein
VIRDRGSPEPSQQERIERALGAAAPLLLLPLRVEYRVVEVARPIRVTAGVSELLRDDPAASIDPVGHAPRRGRAGTRATLSVRELSLRNRREIWFRWFPEDDFAERGIEPPTDDERAALSAFEGMIGAKPWHDAADATVVSAWQTLVRSVAPPRAVHLLRNRAAEGNADWTDRIGSITLLPARVALFGIAADGTVTALAAGTPIADVRYTPEALQDEGWLTNFDLAVSKGMGCRLSDARLVEAALAADWIVAIGLADGDAIEAFATLVGDAVANGTFEFLEQDTPTNNSGGVASGLSEPRADLPAFLARATEAERGVLDSPLEQAADLFSEALQTPASVVRSAAGSGDAAFEDARAMLYVVGPVLFDAVATGVVDWKGLAEDRVLDFFAQSIAARGTLPPVRFGKNPYGILPVTHVSDAEPFAFDSPEEARIDGLLKRFLNVSRAALLTQDPAPVVGPGDPDAASKLEAIFKLNAVSRRLDVADTGSSATRALGCAYVANADWQPSEYLKSLRVGLLRLLPDPDESDPGPPLLYRLARLALAKNIVAPVLVNTLTPAEVTLRAMPALGASPAVDRRWDLIAGANIASLATGGAITGIVPDVDAAIRRMAARLAQGLTHLEAVAARPDGVTRLEILLLETIDLFQHRIDAWASGLAYRRLVRRRRAGRTGLAGGYYGLIGRLRPGSATAGTDGYIQAPSPTQAATAALLRSAHLRHAAGPFAIDLSSARVRRGQFHLDLLSKGLTVAESLGHVGERYLHERRRDDLIAPLRQRFPLRNANDDTSLEIRLFDGLAFVHSDLGVFQPDLRPPLEELKGALVEDLDTLADLVLAEAVHHRAHGQAGAANAWLQVLSGHPVPGRPTVVRTVRSGHASSHRVAWLLSSAPNGTGARALAEPALARLAATALTRFQSCRVAVRIGTGGTAPGATVTARLAADLGLEPLDLLLGGESEIRVRAVHFALYRWARNPALRQALGPLPDENLASFLAEQRPLAIDMDVGNPTAASLVRRAGELRKIVQQARVLEPSDLNAAARPDRPLTDAVTAELLGESGTILAARANALAIRIAADAASARAALTELLFRARRYRNGLDAALGDSELASLFQAVEVARRAYDDALVAVSRYGEPGALRPFTTGEVALAPEEFASVFTALLERVDAKATRLTTAAQAATASPADAASARSVVATLTDALQGALDGDALPILPLIRKRPETTAEADFGSGTAVAGSLSEWAPLRAQVRDVARFAATLATVRAYEVTEAATTTNDPDPDPRPEAEAPRPHYYGTFLADSTFVAGARLYAGIVVDEWAEQRPSRSQTTGVALNYDTPQSEAPNCLLLCEPPTGDRTAWDELSAARMVAETISWMKIRALPAQRRLSPGGLLPQINQVPFKPGPDGKRRIPTRPLIRFPGARGAVEGEFVVARAGERAGLAATGAQEISRLSRTEE